ncbi:peptidase A4 family-domain-containing protein [Diplogelasinospora grovesii]|uniref:Peptidase A4 family-domain-containing protein n=1 Tax=Diplogelasinospora grovesii TaxID=303347 RepID=A0AAN6S198_9PEZI|nr:peptidase A4 family-domain-containing protein [Diplogelasinospora grovesii]
MWSFVRSSIIVGSVLAWVVAADLSFVATAHREGQEIDTSDLKFVPIPPQSHRKHDPASTPSKGSSRGKRNIVSFSGDWCGASQHTTSSDQFTNVFGYFTVPDLTLRPGAPAPQYAAVWVGIDGASCQSTLLQAGVTTVINSNGGQSASAWWEWFPEVAYSIDGLTVKPGDWISVNITASSLTAGTITINNVSRGYTLTISVTNAPTLCRVDAEWIVENFYNGDAQVNFARFSDVWFEETLATTVSGKQIGIDGAAMVYLKDSNGSITCTAAQYDNTDFVVSSQG